jgi:hypothetical protein
MENHHFIVFESDLVCRNTFVVFENDLVCRNKFVVTENTIISRLYETYSECLRKDHTRSQGLKDTEIRYPLCVDMVSQNTFDRL